MSVKPILALIAKVTGHLRGATHETMRPDLVLALRRRNGYIRRSVSANDPSSTSYLPSRLRYVLATGFTDFVRSRRAEQIFGVLTTSL
jgi:hypothetical protein